MKTQDLYDKIKKIKVTTSTITWCLLIGVMLFLTAKINKLEDNISSLNTNQTLILYQLEDNENGVKRVNNEMVKVAQDIANIDNLINKSAKEFGINPALLHAVATVESGKNQNVRSKAGAVGALQVLPSTAKAMGENPYTTEGNIRAGAKYLAYLKDKYKGNEELMLSAYNAGEGNVKRNGNKPPKYTQGYIKKVQNEKQKYQGVVPNSTTTRFTNKSSTVRVHKVATSGDKK